MSSGKQVFTVVVGKMLALIATLFIPMILTRFLSKEDYGIYAQFYAVVLFVVAIFSMGFQTSLYFFYNNLKLEERKQLIWQTFLSLFSMALLTILFFRIPFIYNYLLGSGGLKEYYAYVAIAIVLMIPIVIMEPLYILEDDRMVSIFFPPFEVILKAVFVIASVLVWSTIESVLAGIIVATLLVFLYMLYYIIKLTKNHRIRFNKKLFVSQTKYSIPFGMALVLKTIVFRIDKIICLSVLTASDYAIYAVAFYGIPGIQQLYDSLVQVYIINMTDLFKEGKIENLKNLYKKLTIKTFSYTLPLVLIVALYADKIIILLFTEKYSEAIPYFRVYLITVLFMSFGSGLILRATGKTKRTLRSYIYSSIISIPLTFYLIENYYLWGAMSSAIIGSLLPIFFNIKMDVLTINSNLKDHFPWCEFKKIGLISILTLLPFLAMHIYFDYNIFVSIIFGALYLLTVSYLEYMYGVFVIDTDIVTLKLNNLKIYINLKNKKN